MERFFWFLGVVTGIVFPIGIIAVTAWAWSHAGPPPVWAALVIGVSFVICVACGWAMRQNHREY